MASLGKNLKITAPRSVLSEVRAVFTEIFGAKIAHSTPDMEVYALADGASIGYALVDEGAALSTADAKKGPWIEILVDDPTKAREALGALGIAPFEYSDKARDYYQLPGGVVARLAASR